MIKLNIKSKDEPDKSEKRILTGRDVEKKIIKKAERPAMVLAVKKKKSRTKKESETFLPRGKKPTTIEKSKKEEKPDKSPAGAEQFDGPATISPKASLGGYTAKDIYVLKGLEPVRQRPGMYIGSTGIDGLHHLIYECLDNAIDESMAGYAKNIEVVLLPDNRVRVSDDGRGIPVEKHADTKKSALETVMTTLHAGGKFGGEAYKVSGGLHGVGISVVCALSIYMLSEVHRDGTIYQQEYFRGKPKTSVKKTGLAKDAGTIQTFDADPEIFKEIKYDPKRILNHIRQQAYLTKGVRIAFRDEREKGKETSYSFYFEGGVASYVKYLLLGNTPRHSNIFSVATEKEGIVVEAAFQYTQEMEYTEESFANNIYTPEGGTHISGFRTALTRSLNDYARREGFLKEKDDNFSGDDVREGLTAVISVKIKTPQFEGQTKAKLGNPEAKNAVETAVAEGLTDYLERNPSDAKAIIENCLLATKARLAAKAARQTVLRKGALEGLALPGKLADCLSRKPEESELYIVEGDSAGGSSKMARDRRFQAILPLRGKILNVERARLDKILSSKEIKALIIAMGTGIGEDFDLEKLRYHRIVIMTDADSVTADTPIFVFDKEKQEFFLTEVGKFIENCPDTNKYQVLTYNEKSKKRELKEIYQTIKHPLRTPLYQIKTDYGYSVKVTSCHSVYVFENGKVVTKKGDKIKKGDLLVFPKVLARQNKEYIIDLKDLILEKKIENISFKISQKQLKEIPAGSWCDLNYISWNKLQNQRELVGMSRKEMGESISIYDKIIQQWEQKIDNVMPRFSQFNDYLNKINIRGQDSNCGHLSGSGLRQDSRSGAQLSLKATLSPREERNVPSAVRKLRSNAEDCLNPPARREAKKWLISTLRLRPRSLWLQPPRRALKSSHFLASQADHSSNPAPLNPSQMDYDVYVPIKEWKEKKIPESANIYYGNHSRVLETEFRIDRNLAYLIGFFLGDGCASFEKGSPNRFSLCLGKGKIEKYLKDLSLIISNKLKVKPVIEKRKTGDYVIHFHSFEFKLLLEKLGLLGKKCNEKFVPDIFFNAKKEIQESLLEGLLHSDGFITVWKDKKGNWGKAIFGWQISSEKLSDGIMTILRQLGIFPMYSVRKSKNHYLSEKFVRSNFNSYNVTISTTDYLKNTKKIWSKHKDAKKIKGYIGKDLKKKYKKEVFDISNDFVGIKVRESKRIKNFPDKFVYDFSVIGDQNFIAGNAGVLLHNTDGAHIRTLLLTFFYRHFKPVVDAGHIYIAQPPLYRIQTGKQVRYAYAEDQKDKTVKDMGKAASSIQRYKGLGEMNPEQLWETTMNPENRTLLQVSVEEAHQADKIFDVLMGEQVEPRKKFIQTHAKSVKSLDV